LRRNAAGCGQTGLSAGICPQSLAKVRADTPKLVTDMLVRTLTLSTSLLAGSVAFLNQSSLTLLFRGLIVVLLMAAIVCSLRGLFPVKFLGDSRVADELMRYRRLIDTRRGKMMWYAITLLCLALFAGAIGLFYPASPETKKQSAELGFWAESTVLGQRTV
jgi:hypothetical protein